MPDVLVLDANGVRARVRSCALPLGIQGDLDLCECLRPIAVSPGERLLLSSDGVHEAVNPRGEQFGRMRLERAAVEGARSTLGVKHALDAFRGSEPVCDDASLVEIVLEPALFACHRPEGGTGTEKGPGPNRCAQWRIALDLHADALRVSDPVPMLISQLREVPGLEEHRPVLYTVLSELYSNALEHGVLQLPSALKEHPGGFERYVAERERQLARLAQGWVSLSAVCVQWHGGGELEIRVADSGPGFDWRALPQPPAGVPHGRGLALVRALCRSLEFENGGACARAVYAWGEAARIAA